MRSGIASNKHFVSKIMAFTSALVAGRAFAKRARKRAEIVAINHSGRAFNRKARGGNIRLSINFCAARNYARRPTLSHINIVDYEGN